MLFLFLFCYSCVPFKINLCTKLWIFPGNESFEMEFMNLIYSSLWSLCPSTLEPNSLLASWGLPRHHLLQEVFSPLPGNRLFPGERPRIAAYATSSSKMSWVAQELRLLPPHQNCGLKTSKETLFFFALLGQFKYFISLQHETLSYLFEAICS